VTPRLVVLVLWLVVAVLAIVLIAGLVERAAVGA